MAFAAVMVAAGCDAAPSTATAPAAAGGKADDVHEGDRGPAAHPIVLVHAFHASTTNSWSLSNVQGVLADEGHFVVAASVPSYAGTPERARALREELDAAREAFCAERRPELDEDECLAVTKVHIVGHSQGGLDARYVVSRLGYAEHTLSVTTLSTPHRGTPLGDLGLTLLHDPRAPRSENPVSRAVERLLQNLLEDIRPQGLADAFYWLSETRFENAQREGADEAIPDVDGVHYQSWAGVATSDGELPDVEACEGQEFFPKGRAAELDGLRDAKTFGVVAPVFDEDRHHPNDGHIPVLSARYGDFLGCVPADHLDLIGRPTDHTDDHLEDAGYDYRAFYRALGASLVDLEGD